MSDRTVYGLDFSENGWRMVDTGSCVWVKVPGTNVSLQIREGQPAKIMGAFAADFNAYVEPLRDADSACWTATNSVASSNHLSGTAMDLNWNSHPFQIADAGFDAAKKATVTELLNWYSDTIFWGNNWNSPKDAMHFQMDYDTYGSENVDRVQKFIDTHIRADGFSTFRRGGTVTPPPPASNAADVLARATGLTLARATEILPTVISGLHAADCTNVKRIAMWLAQCGEESAGFSTTEEFASGAEYEGRCSDLGNCSPGDGVKYKGRTWIQITGKAHYGEFSEWAFGKGLCGSPTQFVDNPSSLGDLQWAGIGAAWYWTVSRPDINALSDAGDLLTVTKRINGGTNGLADRQNRYNRALPLGDQLLELIAGDDDLSDPEVVRQIGVIYQELTKKFGSRSPLRHLGEGAIDTVTGFVLNADGSEHVEVCRLLAGYGHPPTLALLREVAGADPAKYPDRQEDRLIAQAILADLTSTPMQAAPMTVSAPVAVQAAPDNTRELADAYSKIANLQAENAQLKLNAALSVQPAALPAVVDQSPDSLGGRIGKFVDSVDGLGLADASDIKERATIAATIAVLGTKNGSSL